MGGVCLCNKPRLLVFLLLLLSIIFGATPEKALCRGNLDHSLHKLDSGVPGPILFIVGGIQGDEPGGFNAASLIVSHYHIKRGQVWVVPNLNFLSIIKRSRGVYGDMNRKFSLLRENDPDYHAIAKIKSLILDPQVSLVLNLHDGSGFYRPVHIDGLHNPRRWGQSVIVDQESIDAPMYGNLGDIARRVAADVNRHLYKPQHIYYVKNTETRLGDKEMEKTLTYFAIQHNKPAFGLETSKSFSTQVRAYYHLHLIESFMRYMGIEYDRPFRLTANDVSRVIEENLALSLCDNRIFLSLENVRKRLRFIPVREGDTLNFTPSNPLVTVVNRGKSYDVFYGNRRLTSIQPQYFNYDDTVSEVSMQVDGREKTIPFGEMVGVEESFSVNPMDGCRVNVIGFTKKGLKNEHSVSIARKDIQKPYSVDKNGAIFRIEVYRGKKFAGMVLVNFEGKKATIPEFTPRVLTQAEFGPRFVNLKKADTNSSR